jgi:LmbE family N-acetylglucosaminyl deacetylase
VANPVFVQAHFDDVALSCGGTVAVLAETDSPLLVTAFAGEPRDGLNEFARLQHEQWALAGGEAVDARRREDANAAIALGDSVRLRWLDYPDAIYRRAEYGSEEGLFGSVVAADFPLIGELARQLTTLGDEFYLPLSVGNHVDHRLVFDAGIELVRRGADVWFYADLPYALDASRFIARIDQLHVAGQKTVELHRAALDRRWAAVKCYASQLPVIFRELDEPRRQFEEFGRAQGEGRIVDRFWQIAAENGAG